MWIVRDELSEDWEITPIIRFVKRKGKLLLQQKYVKVTRVKIAGAKDRPREAVWKEVPLVDDDIGNQHREEVNH
jgi:hypothetical protein